MKLDDKNRFSLVIFLFIITISCSADSSFKAKPGGELIQNIGSDFDLRTEFGSINNLNVKTSDIFAIWWDPAFDHEDDLPLLFSWLERIRKDCIETLGMSDPPNPLSGYYYNVYIHHNHQDIFPDGWGNGQGTDKYGMPFLTLPSGAHLDKLNVYHEGFHIFQYNANSSGFDYSGDAQWYVESSAQWYMADRNPYDINAFIESGAISSNPHLALWHSFGNHAPGDATDWLYQVRQYGMHTYLYYLTKVADIAPEIITDGFYAETKLSPQQYHFEKVGGDLLRDHFADWAAHNTGGFDYLTTNQQRKRALLELQNVADQDNMHPNVLHLVAEDILGIHSPPSNLLPRGWAYNVVKLTSPETDIMTFTLSGKNLGSKGAKSHFEGRIVIKGSSGIRYQKLDMIDNINGSKTIEIEANEREIYFIIASVPEHFEGNQTYEYSIEIE